ncbi:MAG TPA: hypothetical protein DDX39_04090 [Bacteroidales bacterium]|nr:MAG: hypothetical protein A2W98_09250 [Bacteroidetes bacterium GWF2_33_38]OFY84807.1 MAG: hypothetical protein A2236_13440 [Bacteroidetes bacterium RIFOXYA2_FULL_33_7]HBF87802.1 hypothetical protein [Bacteroidales bacterium]
MFQNKYILITVIFIFISLTVFGQGRRRSARWKQNRYEIIYGLGATNFLGELGGADQIGTNFVRDFEVSMTRPLGSIGLRYKLMEKVSATTKFSYGILKGDDKTTEQVHRKNRNLHFRSPIAEFSMRGEFEIIKESEGHRYTLRKVRGLKGFKSNIYVFAGIAGFYFNPKAQYEGKWYALQPLCTEGQGIVPTRKPYSRIQVAFPLGIGLKYGLDRKWSIGVEYGVRKTLTDYIDDVSTTYIDKEILRAEKGDIAAYLSDPSLGYNEGTVGEPNWTGANQQRGDSFDKDAYMFLEVTLTYKLKTTRKGMPKF